MFHTRDNGMFKLCVCVKDLVDAERTLCEHPKKTYISLSVMELKNVCNAVF